MTSLADLWGDLVNAVNAVLGRKRKTKRSGKVSAGIAGASSSISGHVQGPPLRVAFDAQVNVIVEFKAVQR